MHTSALLCSQQVHTKPMDCHTTACTARCAAPGRWAPGPLSGSRSISHSIQVEGCHAPSKEPHSACDAPLPHPITHGQSGWWCRAQGLGEGVALPSMNNLVARHVPAAAKARALGMCFTGFHSGGCGVRMHIVF